MMHENWLCVSGSEERFARYWLSLTYLAAPEDHRADFVRSRFASNNNPYTVCREDVQYHDIPYFMLQDA
jgi:hypothetical protein